MQIGNDVVVAFISGLAGPVTVVVAKAIMDKRTREDVARTGGDAGEEVSLGGDPLTVSGIVLKWAHQLKEDVERIQRRIGELETEVEGLEATNSLLRRHNKLLSRQVQELGGVPWRMPEA